MIAEGRNINITLIFSLDRYSEVMEAYIAGLERLAADPDADLSRVASVASFFISRVDTEVDRRLDAIGSDEALALRGKAAVAQGKLAYQQFADGVLRAALGRARRPGAPGCSARSGRRTSTKNPAYPDTLYVDELIGPAHGEHAARRDASRRSTITARWPVASTRTSTRPRPCGPRWRDVGVDMDRRRRAARTRRASAASRRPSTS